MFRTNARISSIEERMRAYRPTNRSRHQHSVLKPSGDLASPFAQPHHHHRQERSHLIICAALVLLNGPLASGYSLDTLKPYGVATSYGSGFFFRFLSSFVYVFCMHVWQRASCMSRSASFSFSVRAKITLVLYRMVSSVDMLLKRGTYIDL